MRCIICEKINLPAKNNQLEPGGGAYRRQSIYLVNVLLNALTVEKRVTIQAFPTADRLSLEITVFLKHAWKIQRNTPCMFLRRQ